MKAKKTAAQRQAAREADARRYARDRKKRIAAEKAYKESKKGDPTYEAKVKARAKVNNALRDGKISKPNACPNCGRTMTRVEGHHTGKTGAGKMVWRCSRCNPRGAAA